MLGIERKTKYENRYNKNIGRLKCKVTRIYKTILGIPYKQIHAYRETYHGEVKDLEDCKLKK
jgi:hypothetical protein